MRPFHPGAIQILTLTKHFRFCNYPISAIIQLVSRIHQTRQPKLEIKKTTMDVIAVVFDMDGLLIDSERIALRVFEQTCEHFEMGNQFDLFIKILGTNKTTADIILNEYLPAHVDKSEFTAYFESGYSAETRKPVPLLKGVDTLLNYLDENDIPKAVATSTSTERALHKLENSGIRHRFSSITGGDQIANGKPAPDIYLKAAATIDADPRRCLALEDSPNGVKAALSANMHVIQIPQIIEPDAETKALGHLVLSDLDAVVTHLDQHRQSA